MSKQEPIPPTDEELEAMWQQIIANAIEAGTVVPAERLFGGQMYNLYADKLAVTSDRIKAFAILDEVLQKELGYHHGFDWAKYFKGAEHDQCHIVYKNTTDTGLLVGMIHDKIKYILEKKQDRGAHSMQFLSDWKESKTAKPTPTQQRAIPQELQTPEATKVIERAIVHGLIENAPEGLKWCGSKLLLAYLAYLATSKLNLPTKRYNKGNKKDVLSICWRPFEKLFGLTPDTLKGAKQDWDKWHDEWPNEKPNQHEVIEALFD